MASKSILQIGLLWGFMTWGEETLGEGVQFNPGNSKLLSSASIDVSTAHLTTDSLSSGKVLASSLVKPPPRQQRLPKRRDRQSQIQEENISLFPRFLNKSPYFKIGPRENAFNVAVYPTDLLDFPLTYNAHVEHWIRYFRGQGKTFFKIWLERSSIYLPLFRKMFEKANLPQDLVYVALIESGLSPHAVSKSHAVGPWQFIKSTGKNHGLTINHWLDERKDWQKSTQAAIRYLTTLYQKFQDWYLVVAAYNMGENGLERKIKQYKKRNFWKIRPYLPQETQKYVPKLIATLIIAKSPSFYGFSMPHLKNSLQLEVVPMTGGTHLKQLASYLKVTYPYILNLNAELLQRKIPEHISHHGVRVPKGGGSYLRSLLKKEEL